MLSRCRYEMFIHSSTSLPAHTCLGVGLAYFIKTNLIKAQLYKSLIITCLISAKCKYTVIFNGSVGEYILFNRDCIRLVSCYV